MSELLQADVDTLHSLATTLTGHADTVDRLTMSKTMTMPDSPVAKASSHLGETVTHAMKTVGSGIRGMATAATTSAHTYEQLDQAFATQLQRYTTGQQP